MNKFKPAFWVKLQTILSATDRFDNVFSMVNLMELYIPDYAVQLSFLSKFEADDFFCHTKSDFKKLAAVYEEQAYLVCMVCIFYKFIFLLMCSDAFS